MKTIVYFLVEAKLDQIMEHLTLIPDQSSSELVGYIGRAMKQVKKKNESIRPLATQGHYNLNDRDAKQLSDIFAKLGSLNPTEGFQELNHFLLARPEFDIEKHLETSTSEYFIKFVMEGLGKINSQAKSPMKEDVPPPPAVGVFTNGSPAIGSVNGKSQVNGNGTCQSANLSSHSISSTKSQTPEPALKPNRPKLGNLNRNTGIPGPSAIPVAGFRFTRLPPAEQMSPGDVYDFIKNSHQTLGFDPAKVDIQNIQRRVTELSKGLSGTPGERLRQVESMAEETRLKMINFKQKYNSEQS